MNIQPEKLKRIVRNRILESEKVVVWTLAALFPVFIPGIHIAIVYYLWDIFARKVHRDTCSCSCWDTIFKANYEMGVSGYKHIYFNATRNTFFIWTIIVFFVILLYEVAKRCLTLAVNNRIRWSMLALVLSSIYPHYYSWWAYFNYWNDDFYSQWYHQLTFTVTEIISTFYVIRLLDVTEQASPNRILPIVAIAAFHLLASLRDQLFINVVMRGGALHQILRDINFLIPDLMHIWIPIKELRKYAIRSRIPTSYLISTKEMLFWVIAVLSTWTVVSMIDF